MSLSLPIENWPRPPSAGFKKILKPAACCFRCDFGLCGVQAGGGRAKVPQSYREVLFRCFRRAWFWFFV
jgi:hypothetical protein